MRSITSGRGAPTRKKKEGEEGGKAESVWVLFRDRRLVVFLVCAVMFHFANAAMLPLLGEMLAKGQGRNSMMVHVGVRGDHAACHHVAGFLVGAESGDLG
jgi:hypothetical protein